jgi:hypothetical protein
MRKYTLDKRMEEWMKSSGLMGGRGKLPTILQPAQYKSRFRDAMWRYFIMVPSHHRTHDTRDTHTTHSRNGTHGF